MNTHMVSLPIQWNQVNQSCAGCLSAATTQSVNSSLIHPIVAFADGCQSMKISSSISQYFLLQSLLCSEKSVLGKNFASSKNLECSHCTHNENNITDQLSLFFFVYSESHFLFQNCIDTHVLLFGFHFAFILAYAMH